MKKKGAAAARRPAPPAASTMTAPIVTRFTPKMPPAMEEGAGPEADQRRDEEESTSAGDGQQAVDPEKEYRPEEGHPPPGRCRQPGVPFPPRIGGPRATYG